jgi:hypothetical protein
VPPEKSMPSGTPPRARLSAKPPRMIAEESTSACHRQRMKS